MTTQIVSAAHAVESIPDGATLGVTGFRWAGSCEKLLRELGRSYADRGRPQGLTLVFSSASGDNVSNGLEHLAQPGLLKRVIGGFWGATPRLSELAMAGEIEAYNLPQGHIARRLLDLLEQRLQSGARPRVTGLAPRDLLEDRVFALEHDDSLDHVLELADVSRKRVPLESARESGLGYTRSFFPWQIVDGLRPARVG